jgi:probable HAF family extracellular repeat protein
LGVWKIDRNICFKKHLQKLHVIVIASIRSFCARCMAIGVCASQILLVFGIQAAEFVPLGHLDGSTDSSAGDVSDDGTVVVGKASDRGFRWTTESGMVALEDLPSGRTPETAAGVSVDGSVVVGYGQTGFGNLESYRWTLAGGMKGLGTLKDNSAHGVSADGSVVVGRGTDQSSNQAYRWTETSGRVGLGGCCDCCAHADGVSADGSAVVGTGPSPSGYEAFLWTSESGTVWLGDLPGGDFRSDAWGVSANGKVIVGSSRSALGKEAFHWTEANGMVGLGDLPGGEFESEANAVSADGSVVVGNSLTASGNEGFVWTQANGMQRLEDILVANSTTGLDGWSQLSAGGISDNGLWVVGQGTNPSDIREAFLAQLPDSVAPGFKINAGLNDAWFYEPTSGQGFFITVFPDLGFVSLAWFTYDTELPPDNATANLGDPGHRWITAIGQIDGDQVVMDIDITSGGIFDTPAIIDHTDPPGSDGTLILTFDSCNSGTIEYDIPSINRHGTIPIKRVADDNIVICEALSTD